MLKEFQRVFKNWNGKDDLFLRSRKTNHEKDQRLLKLFDDACKTYMTNRDIREFRSMMQTNGMNVQNAVQELYNRLQNPDYEISPLDVYILLFSFIKDHKNDHILVDEVPILHSKSCKQNSIIHLENNQ